MALLYLDGLGVPKSAKEALRLFRLAPNRGHRIAPFEIGRIYEKGLGVKADLSRALKWYRVSADRQYSKARDKIKALEAKG